MARKTFASSARGRQAAKNEKPIPDSRIDFSEIPESTDVELKRARRVGRPRSGNAKQLIAIRVAPLLLAQLRRLAAEQSKPYQTLIHELLEDATHKMTPAPDKKPWAELIGKLKHLREETARINRLIDEDSEKIDPEMWRKARKRR